MSGAGLAVCGAGSGLNKAAGINLTLSTSAKKREG